MNSVYDHLVIGNGYPLATAAALALHALVLAGALWLDAAGRRPALELVQPTVVKALFIDENPQERSRRRLERERAERLERERLDREAAAAAREAERRREAEAARARAERLREQSALLERQELERMRAEAARREREAAEREAAEADRREEREAERRRAADAAARREAEAAAREAARSELELVQSATAVIQTLVQSQWSRPPSARNGMRAVFRICILPTGEVCGVELTESSGDAAFDRSGERAVHRAEPFTELGEVPIDIFNRNFRSLTLIFEPEDLLN